MSQAAGSVRPAALARYPHGVAFAIQIARNLIVQCLGLGMVVLMGLAVAPWPVVLGWTLATVALVAAEDECLRHIRSGGPFVRLASLMSPVFRVATTSAYALAALVLATRGGLGLQLFAFALMTTSMVHGLMRHYRSPLILTASITPYLLVQAYLGFGLAREAIAQGHWLTALAPVLTVAIFAVQVWSARAQLAGAWLELDAARERAEQREHSAQAANRAKSQFLATMSHELRTPLNGVLGMVQALTAEQLTHIQRERVKVIRRSSESLLSVLNDLLDLSKIEASTLELENAEFDLEHMVRGVAAAYMPIAEKKGLSFNFSITLDALGRYHGDPGRIRRILYSLCENAVKFTRAGGVTLRVDRTPTEVIFEITDTGIGIAEADLEHLFEGFFQADATLARKYGGAGLGLAICRNLTILMGGQIEAKSMLGEGSTFTVRLPLEPANTEPDFVDPPAPESEADRPPALRVLAAEDNATNQLVLKALLAQAGITPTLVEDGRQALKAWEAQTWDIVLMDIQMPEMDGIEATRAIRRRERETGRARTPIIAVTANAMSHQINDYLEAGMDGVVPKPIETAVLFSAMEVALDRVADAREAQANT